MLDATTEGLFFCCLVLDGGVEGSPRRLLDSALVFCFVVFSSKGMQWIRKRMGARWKRATCCFFYFRVVGEFGVKLSQMDKNIHVFFTMSKHKCIC